VVVPVIGFTKQQEIAALVEESFSLKQQSESLLEVAKRVVEIGSVQISVSGLCFDLIQKFEHNPENLPPLTPQTTPAQAPCRSCCADGHGTACGAGTADRASSHGTTGGISCCKTTARSCAPGTACRTVYKAWPADIPAFQGFYSPSAAPFRVPPAGA